MVIALRDGQTHPENYNELVVFVADRMGLSDEELSVHGLSAWLMSNREKEDSCSPAIDTEHITAVVLIGELEDKDGYVQSFPDLEGGIALPPS